ATFMTQFTKNITGRFRPCFYDMCKWNQDAVWDGVTNLCTSAVGEKEGRKSLPYHASFAWSTMLVLTHLNAARCDILAGSVIGIAAAIFANNYGPIFSWEYAGLPHETIHERLQAQK
ncbi:hypothetical protein PF005_g26507, partial [Phytophthora fragariae]